MNILSTRGFLQVGGIVLIVVGILGFVGLIGPTADKSIFGESWVFDNAENWAHLIIGIVALIFASKTSSSTQKNLVVVVGVVAILVAVYNIFSTNLLGAGLQSPLDLILHLVIGVWALAAVKGKRAAAA